MVVSRSDSKRRKKDEDTLQGSPKRTKVHAQRKFAQGAQLNSPVLTPVKDKVKVNGSVPAPELLPVKRPKTEEFVQFLCFRGSDMLPKSLEFFNEPTVPELRDEDHRPGPSRPLRLSDSAGGVAKAEAKTKSKPKSTAAVQALKKKYQEQRLAKEKQSLTKLALKVKGKMRTRSCGLEEPEARGKAAASVSRKTLIKKVTAPTVKRIVDKRVTRRGLRSGGELPAGSDVGLAALRKPRKIIKLKPTVVATKNRLKNLKKAVIASSLSDFSSDDEQPLVKKQRLSSRNRVPIRTTNSNSLNRPSRKTKEAATLFMEMLGKDMRSPDEDEDAESVESFPVRKQDKKENGRKESVEKIKVEKTKETKATKKVESNTTQALPKKKLNDKVMLLEKHTSLSSLKSRALRHRVLRREMELKKLKTTARSTILRRASLRSSSQDSSSDVDRTPVIDVSGGKKEKKSLVLKNKPSDKNLTDQKSIVKPKQLAEAVTFNDSDEEPLRSKVSQVEDAVTTRLSVKKTRSSLDKGEMNKSDISNSEKVTRSKAATGCQYAPLKSPVQKKRLITKETPDTSISDVDKQSDNVTPKARSSSASKTKLTEISVKSSTSKLKLSADSKSENSITLDSKKMSATIKPQESKAKDKKTKKDNNEDKDMKSDVEMETFEDAKQKKLSGKKDKEQNISKEKKNKFDKEECDQDNDGKSEDEISVSVGEEKQHKLVGNKEDKCKNKNKQKQSKTNKADNKQDNYSKSDNALNIMMGDKMQNKLVGKKEVKTQNKLKQNKIKNNVKQRDEGKSLEDNNEINLRFEDNNKQKVSSKIENKQQIKYTENKNKTIESETDEKSKSKCDDKTYITHEKKVTKLVKKKDNKEPTKQVKSKMNVQKEGEVYDDEDSKTVAKVHVSLEETKQINPCMKKENPQSTSKENKGKSDCTNYTKLIEELSSVKEEKQNKLVKKNESKQQNKTKGKTKEDSYIDIDLKNDNEISNVSDQNKKKGRGPDKNVNKKNSNKLKNKNSTSAESITHSQTPKDDAKLRSDIVRSEPPLLEDCLPNILLKQMETKLNDIKLDQEKEISECGKNKLKTSPKQHKNEIKETTFQNIGNSIETPNPSLQQSTALDCSKSSESIKNNELNLLESRRVPTNLNKNVLKKDTSIQSVKKEVSDGIDQPLVCSKSSNVKSVENVSDSLLLTPVNPVKPVNEKGKKIKTRNRNSNFKETLGDGTANIKEGFDGSSSVSLKLHSKHESSEEVKKKIVSPQNTKALLAEDDKNSQKVNKDLRENKLAEVYEREQRYFVSDVSEPLNKTTSSITSRVEENIAVIDSNLKPTTLTTNEELKNVLPERIKDTFKRIEITAVESKQKHQILSDKELPLELEQGGTLPDKKLSFMYSECQASTNVNTMQVFHKDETIPVMPKTIESKSENYLIGTTIPGTSSSFVSGNKDKLNISNINYGSQTLNTMNFEGDKQMFINSKLNLSTFPNMRPFEVAFPPNNEKPSPSDIYQIKNFNSPFDLSRSENVERDGKFQVSEIKNPELVLPIKNSESTKVLPHDCSPTVVKPEPRFSGHPIAMTAQVIPARPIPLFKVNDSVKLISEHTVPDSARFAQDNKESYFDRLTKPDSLEMSDKVSSAIDTLMSLKNLQKMDEKVDLPQMPGSCLKNSKGFEMESRRPQLPETDLKRTQECDSKRTESHETKRVKFQDCDIKRVTIQEPETKRVSMLDFDNKKPYMQEGDFRRFQAQEAKLKPDHSQVLKGCNNPKSMLKPGTLIDIAGISHSPDIMAPLRPGSDGEIIPMSRPIRLDQPEPYKTIYPGAKPYEPRVEQNLYGYRWQAPNQVADKEADLKSRLPVNETAWRQAFKNVKDPKSNNTPPAEKPDVRKQLSVTALAKKHSKSKSDVANEKSSQPQIPIPFLRQNKPFLGTLGPKSPKPLTNPISPKKSDMDLSVREKEAEVVEFVRQYVTGGLSGSFPTTAPSKEVEGAKGSSSQEQTTKQQTMSNKIGFKQTLPGQEQTSGSSFLKYDAVKRSNSPTAKANKSSDMSETDTSATQKTTETGTADGTDDQGWDIFRDTAPKLHIPKKVNLAGSISNDGNLNKTNTPSVQPYSPVSTVGAKDSSPSTVPTTVTGIQHHQSNEDALKHSQTGKSRHSSPVATHTIPNMSDNIFKESMITKRTISPTFTASSGNAIKRNSPVPMRSSHNIFKEILPARRSFSPTLPSSVHGESESVGNIFAQNPNQRRSISPLCNKPVLPALSSMDLSVKNQTVFQKEQDNLSPAQPKDDNLGSNNCIPQFNVASAFHQKSVSTVTEKRSDVLIVHKSSAFKSLTIKNELEKKVINDTNLVTEDQPIQMPTDEIKSEKHCTIKQEVNPLPEKQDDSLLSSDGGCVTEGNEKSGETGQAKHHLPLPVEQTLKRLGQTKSPNKKTIQPPKSKSNEENKVSTQTEESQSKKNVCTDSEVQTCSKNSGLTPNKLGSGIYTHNEEGELDLMLKKKVNMTAEEIKRWLNVSSNSAVEHKANCGVLENNVCECEDNGMTPLHIDGTKPENSVELKLEDFSKNTDKKRTGIKKGLSNISLVEKYNIVGNEKEIKDELDNTKSNLCNIVLTKSEDNLASTDSKKEAIPTDNKMADLKEIPLKTIKTSPAKKNDNDSSPTLISKMRAFRLPSKAFDDNQEHVDVPEVGSPPPRDDVSSNDIYSSNDETPDKFAHPERRSIFHQRRSALKIKERRELLSPSVNAFSPENESSVYAFEPDLPPASTPFRRARGKEGRSASTTTDDEESTPSSNSIAVQVNFDNEAVLECSTQTDVQEGDDDDMQTFYIPLPQSSADTHKPPLIQGLAVKVDTEGPDQKVIMRAKLVTKPMSTFNRSPSTPARALMGKPEQKVRPLSVKPPVGTVQPTARPKPKPESPGPSPQAARLAKRTKNKVAATAVASTSSAEPVAPKVAAAKLVEAPTFYPTEKEFEDPLEYIESITPQAEKYGLCRVVPPSNFKPECKVSDDMRFTAYNQYIHKMLHRWGPNVKEMLAIKKYLATQSIALTHPPWIGGMEVDLPRLYQTVQQCGGLKEVIEKKRWHKVADLMKIPKSAQDRVTKLDDIYCKFLLPYDTLSHAERTQLFEEVEKDWIEREKRVADCEDDDDDESDSESDIDECIVKGRSMALNAFYRIARNTMSMWFPKTESPAAADVELEFWRHVASRQHHVCVHSGSIDSGAVGYGFPTGKNSNTSRHPWNLKVLTNNPGSVLRFLGPVMGVTVPTLHVGMLFSACCWYRDPHGLPWIEYLHTGASKIWYGIPDSSSGQFRSAVQSLVPRVCQDKTLWLASDTAMVPPPLLVERGVSLSRVVQDPGHFIIVFPKAFTSSVCAGYLVSESVYFAPPSWLTTAQNLFNDMRESREPTMFSLDKLLFSLVTDSRSSTDVLSQIENMVVSLRDGEVAGRRQLEELGMSNSERVSKKRKSDDEEQECDQCRTNLHISYVSNAQDGTTYCLPHAVELLSHKRSQVKHCTLLYSFSEDELEDLVEKMKSRLSQKKAKCTKS